MKKNYYLGAILALIVLGHSCKKDDSLDSESKINKTTTVKAGTPVTPGDVKFQIGLMKSEAKEAKVQPGDCKFQLSLQ